MVLRRTRHRLLAAQRDDPTAADTLGAVIEALAAAEMELIARDPELPRRRGRGPRGGAPPPSGDQVLHDRIRVLEQDVRTRDDHLAIVAHDLRNPLTPMFLNVQRLLDDVTAAPGDTVPLAWLRPRVEAIGQRLQQFVGRLNRLLDASRLQAGHVAIEPEDVDLAQVVTALVAALRAEQGADAPELRVDAAEPVRGTWDRLRVEQIATNLIANALQYGDGAPVELAVVADGAVARLVVTDHGPGIAEEDHARIFDRYTRSSRKGQGLGLGLWIARQLARAMGGDVTVRSAPGQGATFVVELPRRA